MIVVLGDIHFRDDRPYWDDVCERFLSWFDSYDRNNPDNTLILAGDLVEEKLLSGKVADYLHRFIHLSRFKEVHICVGNHDRKEYHGRYQLSYEFYKNIPNVHVYENDKVVDIEGLKVLILPYYLGVNDIGIPMNEYYSGIYRNSERFSNDYNLVVGHFCDERNSIYGGGSDCISNLDKIVTDKMILGHVHTRGVQKDTPYIGSVFAGRKTENDYRRCAMVYDNGVWYEDRLPLFNEFLSVTYPEDLPKSKAMVPIYTVLNCSSESVAISRYGNINIRRVTTDSMESPIRRPVDMDRQFSSIKEMDTVKLMEAFLESQDVPFDERIKEDCRKMVRKSV